jgi:hypothetical protein
MAASMTKNDPMRVRTVVPLIPLVGDTTISVAMARIRAWRARDLVALNQDSKGDRLRSGCRSVAQDSRRMSLCAGMRGSVGAA